MRLGIAGLASSARRSWRTRMNPGGWERYGGIMRLGITGLGEQRQEVVAYPG